jgi:hypothetical protein
MLGVTLFGLISRRSSQFGPQFGACVLKFVIHLGGTFDALRDVMGGSKIMI